LPKIVTRQRRGCDLNPGPSAPESSTLTTRLPTNFELYDPSDCIVVRKTRDRQTDAHRPDACSIKRVHQLKKRKLKVMCFWILKKKR